MGDTPPDYVRGTSGNDDIRATNAGAQLVGGAGDDILRGGKGDDFLIGGAGDDMMYGGAGADQFRFFANQIDGPSDRDKIIDLTFGEGDTLVFGNFSADYFHDGAGVNAYTGGTAATVSSIEGLHSLVNASGGAITAVQYKTTDALVLTMNIDGKQQIIQLNGLWNAYHALDVVPV